MKRFIYFHLPPNMGQRSKGDFRPVGAWTYQPRAERSAALGTSPVETLALKGQNKLNR